MISIVDKVLVVNSDRYNHQQIGTVTDIRIFRIYGSGFLNLGLYCVEFNNALFGVYAEDELELVTENENI